MKENFYNFTVHIDERDKKNLTVNIKFHGCKTLEDAEELAEYINIILNVPADTNINRLH